MSKKLCTSILQWNCCHMIDRLLESKISKMSVSSFTKIYFVIIQDFCGSLILSYKGSSTIFKGYKLDVTKNMVFPMGIPSYLTTTTTYYLQSKVAKHFTGLNLFYFLPQNLLCACQITM